MNNPETSHPEQGNVFVFVLIGIVLFAALAFTFTRSAQQGTGNFTIQQARVAAGDILSYAQYMERAVSKIRVRRVSESLLDFENTSVTGYTNPACTSGACEIFNPQGGQMVWQNPPAQANNASPWVINGTTRVSGVGTDGAVASAADLLLILPNVDKTVCAEINTRLGISNPSGNPPRVTGSTVNVTAKFIGGFSMVGDPISVTELNGRSAGCFEGNGTPATATYHFYQVLLAR
ncbi:MAG: hypothetical protein J0L77_06430 [Alphaproteobacteria bacterium]|nr:hypothetical protein [Alphaproteobacteria bacterium]